MSDEKQTISKLARETLRRDLTALNHVVTSLQKQVANCVQQLDALEQTAAEKMNHRFGGIKLDEEFIKEFFENKSELRLTGNDVIFASVDVSKHPDALRDGYFYPFFGCSKPLSFSDLNLDYVKLCVEFTREDRTYRNQEIVCSRYLSDEPVDFSVHHWDGKTSHYIASRGSLGFASL